MFLIPTYLDRSEIQGTGVFTPHFIPRGTTLWDFTPGVDWEITVKEMSAFPEPFQSRLREWSYLDERGLYVLCGDSAKFMNHSFEPNCDDSGGVTTSLRDIVPGEELTCDYRVFDRNAAQSGLEEYREAATARSAG